MAHTTSTLTRIQKGCDKPKSETWGLLCKKVRFETDHRVICLQGIMK